MLDNKKCPELAVSNDPFNVYSQRECLIVSRALITRSLILFSEGMFDCEPCPDNTVSNITGGIKCVECPTGSKEELYNAFTESNAATRDKCLSEYALYSNGNDKFYNLNGK